MKFRILGCLEAEADGRRLPLGGPSEQKALALLLLDANRVVTVSRLVDAVWDDPPETAAKQARNAVSRLRNWPPMMPPWLPARSSGLTAAW